MFDAERKWWGNFFKKLLGKGDTPVTPIPPVKPVEPPKTTYYSDFDPQDTLPDALFSVYDESLDIQGFFERKKSYLATYKVNGKSVAQIINDACKPYLVNQKYILILLQKESMAWSIPDITKVPTRTILTRYKDAQGNYVKNADGTFARKEFIIKQEDWCLCFGVPDDDPPNMKFYGFENQIVSCAKRIRYLFDEGASQMGKQFKTLGHTVLTDALLKGRSETEKKTMASNNVIHQTYVQRYGLAVSNDPEKNIVVTLKNKWAWLLYMYTPHVGAQELTWKIWKQEWAEDLNSARK